MAVRRSRRRWKARRRSVRLHQQAPVVGHGLDVHAWRLGLHAAEDGGEGRVGRVAAGGQAHEAHRYGGARGVEQVPAVGQPGLHVGVEVRWAQRRVGAVVEAGGKTRRDIDGAAQRDHQVREVTAHALLVVQGVAGGGQAVRGVGAEGHLARDPVADGQHAAVTVPQRAELLHGKLVQLVGFAVAAGVQVGQHLRRQVGDRAPRPDAAACVVVGHVDRGLGTHAQRAGQGAQAQRAGVGHGVGVRSRRHRLADFQPFAHHPLVACPAACRLKMKSAPGARTW